jgi:probable phosphoglycerate mutase
LIRHGQIVHNLDGRWIGREDIPLTEAGQRQALALAQRLASWSPPVDCVYTSPLRRARQTAEPIARALEVTPILDEGLQEIDLGMVSGLTIDTLRETMPEVYTRWQDRQDLTFRFPGGEQRLSFYQRVGRALDEIVAWHPGEQVVVIAHEGTLRAGLVHLFPPMMSDQWAYDLRNASLTHVRAGDGENVLVSLNDCQHLQGQ